ncbi:MarR family winged helix-turn-helix transcriptional regulator [Deinococcus sedimenti]|uniref:HTH marR-type domain-containing protein n=1 Tax=Deinococcus sedimenti TaxID=1867090 RepID=A0ABQ2S385_9DEIO|nr:MarR family transcriptional regulator [Deinococcus sedimenti]GGR92779.1 hypothetical protein GCM10008960_19720 [Deinococcus sedimenti]
MTVDQHNEVAADREAGALLRTVTRLFTELQQRNFACCDVQSSTQCLILSTLHREGPQTLTALTRSLNLDKAWLSRSTDDLAQDGHLIKAPHPSDRRALLLQLTEAGQDAARTLDTNLNAQSARVLARLPTGDRDQALRLLGTLSAALEAELHGDPTEAGCAC